MAKKTVVFINKNGNNVGDAIALNGAKPVKIKAQPNVKYLLKDAGDFAPENATLTRVGDDLHVTLEGESSPALVLEGYFGLAEPAGIYGMAEDGQLYAYGRTDGGDIFSLADGESSAMALAGDPVSRGSESEDDNFVFWPLLLAGGLGAAGFSAVSSNGGSKYFTLPETNEAAAPAKSWASNSVEGTIDDVGAVSLKDLDGTNGFVLSASGTGTNALLGNGVRAFGDVNGDGIDDFMVGAPNADTDGKTDNGAVYLVYGVAGGTWSANMDLDAMVASGQAKKWTGTNSDDFMGTNSAIGDWNGDGLKDLAISAWESDVSITNGGSYSIYSGDVDSLTQSFTVGDDEIFSKAGFADRLSGGAGNDFIANVSTGDVAYGGAGNDRIAITSDAFTRVDGGLGMDTLVLDGSAMHIDLSVLGMKVQGFEKFDLGSGGNSLSLRESDVLAGQRNLLLADGKVQMQVNGANGEVDLQGSDWTHSDVTVGSVHYNVYTNLGGTLELLVEDKVHVTIL